MALLAPRRAACLLSPHPDPAPDVLRRPGVSWFTCVVPMRHGGAGEHNMGHHADALPRSMGEVTKKVKVERLLSVYYGKVTSRPSRKPNCNTLS